MNEPMNKPAAAPLAGQVKAKVEPIIANTEALAKAQQVKQVVTPTQNQAERTPSNWSIRSTGPDTIEAYCNATGTRFEGTVEELNQKFFR